MKRKLATEAKAKEPTLMLDGRRLTNSNQVTGMEASTGGGFQHKNRMILKGNAKGAYLSKMTKQGVVEKNPN